MGVVPKNRYDGVAMIIHWLTAVLMIFLQQQCSQVLHQN